MANYFLVRAVFLSLLLPTVASGAALDDYYLSKFGAQDKVARTFSAVVEQKAGHAERCRTHLYRSLKRDWSGLEPTTQKVLASYVSRPVLADGATFTSNHFNIHYSRSGDDAPAPVDADADQVPDWVEKVAAVFEQVYAVEVTGMGYKPPPVARYDVYLKNLVSQAAYGFTKDDGPPVFPAVSSGSYIEIDRAFSDDMYTENGRYDPEQMLQITAAHEFHHAIQFGYNYYFDIWYAEVTSTWMEDEVYDSVNQLYSYLPAYLPRASTLSLNAPLGSNSEYGRWIFNRYLAEAHTPSLIKDFWVKLGTMPALAGGSDIPMLPVINTVLGEKGSNISGALLGFAKKLSLQEWAADNSLIPAVAPQASYSEYPVNLSAMYEKIAVLPKYTFAYYKFLPGQSAPSELTLTLPNVPAGIDIVAIKKGTNGSVDEYAFDRASGTVTVPFFNAVTTSEVQLIICNSSSIPAPVVTAPVVAAPVSTSNNSGGGGCFIATAAYGSYLHPKVAELRNFRDRHLLTNAPGRLFVALYYRLSPPVAQVIREHEWMRGGVRLLLLPLVLAVEYPVGALLVLMLAGGGAVFGLARRRRALRLATVFPGWSL